MSVPNTNKLYVPFPMCTGTLSNVHAATRHSQRSTKPSRITLIRPDLTPVLTADQSIHHYPYPRHENIPNRHSHPHNAQKPTSILPFMPQARPRSLLYRSRRLPNSLHKLQPPLRLPATPRLPPSEQHHLHNALARLQEALRRKLPMPSQRCARPSPPHRRPVHLARHRRNPHRGPPGYFDAVQHRAPIRTLPQPRSPATASLRACRGRHQKA